MDRRKTKDILWFALQCAKQDRIALADAYENKGYEANQAFKDIKAFKRIEQKLFGSVGNSLDEALSKMKPVTIQNLFKIFDQEEKGN